uniref:Uncharacterized protein n=1 Tax=candidate division WOR-3 bacterium TaxID=2052148 RepID=A0A7C2K3T6_UNCW3
MKLITLQLLFAFCPLCVGVAVGGSLFSRFLPGAKMYLINSLWFGFLFFSIIKWIYERWSILLIVERDNRKKFVKGFLGFFIFFAIYLTFLLGIYILNGKEFKASYSYSFHAGFFASMTAYELYHLLFEKGIKIKYGSTLVPGFLLVLLSMLYYLI